MLDQLVGLDLVAEDPPDLVRVGADPLGLCGDGVEDLLLTGGVVDGAVGAPFRGRDKVGGGEAPPLP
ncbi:hypothetical protein TN53_25930 [Streptomyces sp. WM6386]|nr:hypothetical protein TN53_25930 [Streptomyces sp. WM6386]